MPQKRKKKSLRLIDKIVLGFNILVSLCLLLCYLAPSTDPKDSTLIAILGFGYLLVAGANLIFPLYWVFRKPVFMLISIVCVLAGFNFIKAQFGFRKSVISAAKANRDNIRIMQYNVRGFVGIGRYDNTPIHSEVVDIVNEEQPDIVNFEEYSKRRFKADSATNALKKALKTPFAYFNPYKITKTDTSGNAIFSKYPILQTGEIATNNLLNTKAIFVDIKYKGKILRVYCIHLAAVQARASSKKKMLSGKSLGNTSFLFGRMSGAFVTRSFQVAKIKRNIQDCPYPFVLTGDFNDTPISFAVNEISEGLSNAFIEKGSGFQTTYYSAFPLQLDYIFASKEFEILNYKVIDKELSDHKPVISDVRLK